jgi:hypothetical protein
MLALLALAFGAAIFLLRRGAPREPRIESREES